MIAGQRVLTVFLARMGSRRLPGKMLLPLGETSVFERGVGRHRACGLVDDFVLATTTSKSDDPLANLARDLGLDVVRGSECDVLGRMMQAWRTRDRPADVVVRACLDNPLAMPDVVDAGIEALVSLKADLISPFELNGHPFGFGAVVITKDALQVMDSEAKSPVHREHVESYAFDHPDRFAIAYQPTPEALFRPDLSLTLDVPEDYTRLQHFLEVIDGVPLGEQAERIVSAAGTRVSNSEPFWRPDPAKRSGGTRIGFPSLEALAAPKVVQLGKGASWAGPEHPLESIFSEVVVDEDQWVGLLDPRERLGNLEQQSLVEVWHSWQLHSCRLDHLNRRQSPSCRAK